MAKKEKKLDISSIIKVVADVAGSEKGQSFICGRYSDGEPRSVIDALRDEYISPRDREYWEKKKNKKKKKRKKAMERYLYTDTKKHKKKEEKKKKNDTEILNNIFLK